MAAWYLWIVTMRMVASSIGAPASTGSTYLQIDGDLVPDVACGYRIKLLNYTNPFYY